jgi:hypothetical protein
MNTRSEMIHASRRLTTAAQTVDGWRTVNRSSWVYMYADTTTAIIADSILNE